MTEILPTSPIEVACRTCMAPVNEKCTTRPKVVMQWVRVLNRFHDTRWRDFNRVRNERAAMNDWNQKYGKDKERTA